MRRAAGETGFTLIEVMIAVALLGVGLSFITQMFLGGYRLWKRSFDELIIQRQARTGLSFITQALREAAPGTVKISTPAGMPMFSEIQFKDGRDRNWWFHQKLRQYDSKMGTTIYEVDYWMNTGTGAGTTQFLADHVDAISFVYPSFQDTRLIDVGITMRVLPYRNVAVPVVIQLVERVLMRNP